MAICNLEHEVAISRLETIAVSAAGVKGAADYMRTLAAQIARIEDSGYPVSQSLYELYSRQNLVYLEALEKFHRDTISIIDNGCYSEEV